MLRARGQQLPKYISKLALSADGTTVMEHRLIHDTEGPDRLDEVERQGRQARKASRERTVTPRASGGSGKRAHSQRSSHRNDDDGSDLDSYQRRDKQ